MSDPLTHTASDRRELIAFCIGEQEFAVDIMSVREIRGWSPATPLPQTPAYMRGVINLRGAVLPIIDLSARLGLERQWLHAVGLGFEHPGTGEYVTFESPYPQDLERALDLL